MQRIPVKKALPGMVLAQAVTRPEGPVLVGDGHTLTEALIARIREAGVNIICVEGNPLGGGGTVGVLDGVARNLNHAFRRHEGDVFMMTLRNMLARYFAHKIAAQRAMEEKAIARTESAPEEGGGTQ